MAKKKLVVLVEDDPEQVEILGARIAGMAVGVEVLPITCEAEFIDQFGDRPAVLPDLFVIDVMIEWKPPCANSQRAHPGVDHPEDEAGIRCLERIRKYSATTPVIVWTITNKHMDLAADQFTIFLSKAKASGTGMKEVSRLLQGS